MILDIIVVAILVIAAITGFHKGFVYSIIHLAGWAVSLLAAFFLTPVVKPVLQEHTGFYDWLHEGFSTRFSTLSNASSASEGSLPHTISSIVSDSANSLTSSLSSTFADLVLTILTFFLLLFVLKLILWILLRIMAKNYNRRINGVDGFFGIIIGIVRGLIYVCIFMAALIPFMNLMPPDFTTSMTASLSGSHLAGWLYENNPLLMLLQFALA